MDDLFDTCHVAPGGRVRIYGDTHPELQNCILVEVKSETFITLLNGRLTVSHGILARGIHEGAQSFETCLDIIVVWQYAQHTERFPKDFRGILRWRCRGPGSTAIVFEFGRVGVLYAHAIKAARPIDERI